MPAVACRRHQAAAAVLRRTWFALCLALGATALFGCGAAHFEYPLYTPRAQPHGTTLPVRVAIAYPDEGRAPGDRDEDLEPIITKQCDATNNYVSPRLENSRCLLDELRATRAFAAVHWSPESLDDYDIVVRLRLISAGPRRGSSNCPSFSGPYDWGVVITDRGGRELGRLAVQLARPNIYAVRVVADFRKKQQDFVAQIVPAVIAAAERVARAHADPAGPRLRDWMDRLDPDLPGMRARLESPALPPAQRPPLEQDYLMRVAMLESLRLVEDQKAEAAQQLKDKAWAEVQAESARELKRIGERATAALQEAMGMLVMGMTAMARMPGVAGKARMPAALERATASARADVLKLVDAPDGPEKLLGLALRTKGPSAASLARLPKDDAFRGQLTKRLHALGRVKHPSTDPDGAWMRRYRRLVARGVEAAEAGDEPRRERPAADAPRRDHPAADAPRRERPAADEPRRERPAADGCVKDTDCKGDRICVRRECVDPPARSAAPPR
jgi:hypothetical protein